MGRTPREEFLIQHRRQQVAELYLQGWTQAAIARELRVSQGTVSADLSAVRNEWKESRSWDFKETVAIELKKLERVEREAWAAWERSQQPIESTKVVNDGEGKKAEKTVKHQPGDPRYLELVHRCVASRRSLLGLDAPTRIAPTSPDGDEAYHVHVMAELMRLAEETRDAPQVIDAQYIERALEEQVSLADGQTESTAEEADSEEEEDGDV